MPVFPERFNLAHYFLFDRLAEGLGQTIAIRFGARSYTYEEVARQTSAFATALGAADIRRGERVLIVLPDVPAFAAAFFGTLARGCVVAMGNPDSAAEQIEYLVDYTRATAIVTIPRVAKALAEAIRADRVGREVRRVWVVSEARALSGDDDPFADVGPDDGIFCSLPAELARPSQSPAHQPAGGLVTHRDEPAIWLFTSGSTGEPKANIHTHRDFAFNTELYAKATAGYAKGDVTVSVPRLYFGYATGTNLMFPFAVGATVGLFSERPTPESLAAAIALYRPTIITNVPTMLGKLLEHDQALRSQGKTGLDLSTVRFSLSSGEALPEALLTRWLERFASDVYDGIGSAEMFHIYATNRAGDIKPGSLGRAVEGYELRVLPEEAEGPGAAPCAPGEIGVLWVRGDSVSQAYWLDRNKSWKTFHGHWCRTGDLFRLDEQGYLYFAGRADDLLKVSGQWVAPIEVEECLMKHEAVALAAVIGVEDEGLMKPKAFVVLRGGVAGDPIALAKELQDFVKARLAMHKYPRIIEFVADVPKNDRGKVDRRALAKGAAKS